MAKLYFSIQDLLGVNPPVRAFKAFNPEDHTYKTVIPAANPKDNPRPARCSVADKVEDYQKHNLIFEITNDAKVGEDVSAADQESVADILADMLDARK